MRHQRELNSNTKPDTIYNLILSLSFYKLYIWKLFLNANVKCNVKCNGRFHISNTCIQTNREKSVKKRAPVVNNEMPWTCLEKVEPFFTWMYQILFDMWTIENVRKFSKFVSFFFVDVVKNSIWILQLNTNPVGNGKKTIPNNSSSTMFSSWKDFCLFDLVLNVSFT